MHSEAPVQPTSADLSARLEASREALMDAIAGLDEEGFRVRPRPSEWSAAEVLAHLFAADDVFMQRAQAALTEEDFVVTPRTEEQEEEDARLAQRMAVPQILHGLLAQRRDTVRLLEGLSPQQLARSFRHPRRGELTVAYLFQRAAEHEEEHAAQVRALRARPAVGRS